MFKLIINEHHKLSELKRGIVLFLLTISVFIVIYYNRNTDSMTIYNTIYYFIPFVGMAIILLYGDIISSEYQYGTFKHYINKSYSRWKILLSKVLYVFISIFLIITYIILLYYLFIFIFKNFDKEIFKEILKTYMYSMPLYFISMLCIFISILSRNNSISITISILFFLMSGIIFQLCLGLEYTLMEYSFLPYLDYSFFLDTNYVISLNREFGIHLNEYTGVIVLFINIVVMYVISNLVFIKKDI